MDNDSDTSRQEILDKRRFPYWAQGFSLGLVMEFFFVYSRFEYALKKAEFLKPDRKNAEADWDRFGHEVAEAYKDAEKDKDLRDAIECLDKHPPQRQIRNPDGTLDWTIRKRNGQTEIVWLLNNVKGVRNNLFHGGKRLYDPARDDPLLKYSIIFLKACLSWHPGVKKYYEHLHG